MKGFNCGKCGRTVWCHQEGDAWVGQCYYCGQFHVADAELPPAPKKEPKLLGVQVDYWDDDPERGFRRSRFFEDPEEGCKFEEECKKEYLNTQVWPVWEDQD